MTTTPKRRWFQFSLRSLLVVMTLLCLGPGGYVAYEQGKAREKRVAVQAIEKLGGYLFYDESIPPRSAFARLILGDETFGNVNGVDFNPLKTPNRQITDADLGHLRAFPRLNHLALKNCRQITPVGLRELAGRTNLQYLYLTDTPITDDALVHLAGLSNLKELSLPGTQITDAGLVYLTGLGSLEFLYLYSTRVTPAGVEDLHQAIPRCHINADLPPSHKS